MQTQAQMKDLVLVGGGHAHLSVIKYFAMHPIQGLRITVISKDILVPYSGMLPGLIAGHYQTDDIHIDLRPLCQFAQARLFHGHVNQIDLSNKQLHCDNRPPIRFDWLSINTGSYPALNAIKGACNRGFAVKPIKTFMSQWKALCQSLASKVGDHHIAVVGGGAASVEVLLAAQYYLQQHLPNKAQYVHFHLVSSAAQLLTQHNHKVRQKLKNILSERGVQLHLNSKVVEVTNNHLLIENGKPITANDVIWAIHAGSSSWPKSSGLSCDREGFIHVNHFLQSSSHSHVFAAGDIAHFETKPLPKSGVYAVRAGKILAENLHRAITGRPLKAYRPQHRFLSLLMTGNQQTIASRGAFYASGTWLWRWKDRIDRQFVARFNEIPAMDEMAVKQKSKYTTHGAEKLSSIRCGGCGAKVSDSVLKRVMKKLQPITNQEIVLGLDAPDDAAVIQPPPNKQWLQTVDYFRAFIDDPYLLGRIATNHCLSDIYAMGGQPHSALAIATVPIGSAELVEDTLLQLMSGAVDSLNDQGAALIGGHSSEGTELGFGLSVNGVIDPNHLLTKGRLEPGQPLILTKGLGTGTLFAANMQGQAKGNWIEQALHQMLIDNRKAAHILQQHGATACTDITGFGLLGHLTEMLKAAGCGATLILDQLPLLEGATSTLARGYLSSLYPENLRFNVALINNTEAKSQPLYPILFDPQTAGGLLAAVPANQITPCLHALREAGYPNAECIAQIDPAVTAGNILLK